MTTEFTKQVSNQIGQRSLIWFGTRGIDALPLLVLSQFEECYAITGSPGLPGINTTILEELTGRRVDLDRYDIDLDPAPALGEVRSRLLASLNQASLVISYRPSRFLSAIQFARLDTFTPAFLFHEHHLAFEHKPWVETELTKVSIQTIPWQYVADEQHAEVYRRLQTGPVILRPSRGSGGVGLIRVDSSSALDIGWPSQAEAFVSVAPFIDGATPVNVAACAFPDGSVTLHSPSVQLIGLSQCIDRMFGYCGNDYAAAEELTEPAVAKLAATTLAVGVWLVGRGYRGAYGVDYLVRNDEVLFTEINPRFQGCSLLGFEVDRLLGLPDLHLEHLAAHLGMPAPPRPQITDRMANHVPTAHIVVHNTDTGPWTRVAPAVPTEWPAWLSDITLVPPASVAVDPGGVLFRLVVNGPITRTGFDIDARIGEMINELRGCYAPTDALVVEHSGASGTLGGLD